MIEKWQSINYQISKKEFFKQSKYKRERAWINALVVFMYVSAIAVALSLAINCQSVRNSRDLYEIVYVITVPLAVYGVIMASVILIKRDSASSCCIVSSIIYAASLVVFAMYDVVIIVIFAMASAFNGASANAIKGLVIFSLIIQVFTVILPLAGSLFATMGTLKINKDWVAYQQYVYRMNSFK